MLDDRISELIGKIYGGAHDPVAWDDALRDILAVTGSRFTMVSAVDLTTGTYLHNRFFGPDDARFLDGVDAYNDHMFVDDPTLAFAKRHPRAGFVSLPTAARHAGADDSYGRWTRDVLGVGASAVCYTTIASDILVGMSLHPPARREAHDDRDLILMRLLFVHVRQAIEQSVRPDDLADTCRATIVLDRRGSIVDIGGAARDILARCDGIRIAGNRLAPDDPGDHACFHRLLRSALSAMTHGSHAGAMPVRRPSGRPPWIVRVVPTSPRWNPIALRHPAARVTIVSSDRKDTRRPVDTCARLYGLTRTEAVVAAHLSVGARDGEIARAMGIGTSTVRTHVKAIFAKTDTTSKPALAHLLTLLTAAI